MFAAYENPLLSKGKEWAKENVRADYSLLSSISLLGFSAIKKQAPFARVPAPPVS